MSTSIGTISLDMILNSAKFKKQLDNVQNQANLASQKIADSLKKLVRQLRLHFQWRQ